MRDNFNFFVPVEISKGKNKKGEEKMMFKGIASTADKDTDGENLLPGGFDLTPLQKYGYVNWDHQTKTNPAAIIGEPTLAELRKEGLYIEAELYPDSPLAVQVYEAAKILEKSGSKRSFGFSIEGKALERKSNDKTHPDFKIITKAMITGVAITPSPKNRSTLAQIMKGEGASDEDLTYETESIVSGTSYIVDVTRPNGDRVTVDADLNIKIEKGLDTTIGKPIMRESVEGTNHPGTSPAKAAKDDEEDSEEDDKKKKKISKSHAFEILMPEVSNDINKANDYYSIALRFESKLDKNFNPMAGVSPAALEAARNFLTQFDADIQKGEEAGSLEGQTTQETTENAVEPEVQQTEVPPVQETTTPSAEETEAAIAFLRGQKTEKAAPAPVAQTSAEDPAILNEIVKSNMDAQGALFTAQIAALNTTLAEGFKAIATLVESTLEKSSSSQEDLSTIRKGMEELQADISTFASQPAAGRKSIQTSNYLEKGNPNGQLGGQRNQRRQLSILGDKKHVMDLLEVEADIKIEKGEIISIGNPAMAQALATYEAASTLPMDVIKTLAIKHQIDFQV